jgi:hypothetical protein
VANGQKIHSFSHKITHKLYFKTKGKVMKKGQVEEGFCGFLGWEIGSGS